MTAGARLRALTLVDIKNVRDVGSLRLLKEKMFEKFDLVRQGKKSVTSISLTIAESSVRGKKEFRQFIRISLGSFLETVANLKIGARRKYIAQNDLGSLENIEHPFG